MSLNAFTLKYNSAECDREKDRGTLTRRKAYAVWKNQVCQHYIFKTWNEEFGDNGRLHIHGTVEVPKSWSDIHINTYNKMKNIHPYFKKIYDVDGWDHYIAKEQEIESNFKADHAFKVKEAAEVVKLLKPLPKNFSLDL